MTVTGADLTQPLTSKLKAIAIGLASLLAVAAASVGSAAASSYGNYGNNDGYDRYSNDYSYSKDCCNRDDYSNYNSYDDEDSYDNQHYSPYISHRWVYNPYTGEWYFIAYNIYHHQWENCYSGDRYDW